MDGHILFVYGGLVEDRAVEGQCRAVAWDSAKALPPAGCAAAVVNGSVFVVVAVACGASDAGRFMEPGHANAVQLEPSGGGNGGVPST